MAQKKITDLQLISSISSTLNVPVDNSTQTYRATAAQFKSFFNAKTIISKTALYTVDVADEFIQVSAASADYTITLPSASGISGKIFAFKRTDANLYYITIDGAGAETIDGYTSVKLCTQNEYLEIMSDGTNWIILNHKCNTPWASYTPVFIGENSVTWTNTTVTGKWRRVGDSIECYVRANMTGTPASGTTSYVTSVANRTKFILDTAKMVSSSNSANIGFTSGVDSGTASRSAKSTVFNAGSGYVVAQSDGGSAYWGPTVPHTWTTNDSIEYSFKVPITDWLE